MGWLPDLPPRKRRPKPKPPPGPRPLSLLDRIDVKKGRTVPYTPASRSPLKPSIPRAVPQARRDLRKLASAKPKRSKSGLKPKTSISMLDRIIKDRKRAVPYKPQSPTKTRVVFDEKTRTLFEYKAPSKKYVSKNVEKILDPKQPPKQARKAVYNLQRVGILDGGNPKDLNKMFTPLGKVPKGEYLSLARELVGEKDPDTQMAGFIGGRTVKSVDPITGKKTYKGDWTTENVLKPAAKGVSEVIDLQRKASEGQQAQRAAVLGDFDPGKKVARNIEKGALAAGGFGLKALEFPLAVTQAGIGKGLVEIGAIKGETARRIKRARGPIDVIQAGGRNRSDVHGSDIVTGLGGPKELALAADLSQDPWMWAGVGGLPASRGRTAPLIAERIARTRRILESAKKTKGQEIVTRPEGIGRRLLPGVVGRQVSRFRLSGSAGKDAVKSVAEHTKRSELRPGAAIRIYPKTVFSSKHYNIPIPVPRKLAAKLKVVPTAKGKYFGSRTHQLRVKEALGKALKPVYVQRAAAIKTLDQEIQAARTAGNKGRVNELEMTKRKTLERFDNQEFILRTETLAKVNDGLSSRVQTLDQLFHSQNLRRLSHRTSRASAELGRTTTQSFDRGIEDAIQPLREAGYKGQQLDDAMARINLVRDIRQGTGPVGIDTLKASGVVLNDVERVVDRNLTKVYEETARHGKDAGTLNATTRNYNPRLWSFEREAVNDIEKAPAAVRNTVQTRRGGHGASFQKHRSTPSITDLADKRELAKVIARAAGKDPENKAVLEEYAGVADKLWREGTVKTHTELLARRIERNEAVWIDDLTDVQREAAMWAGIKEGDEVMGGVGQDVPLFKSDGHGRLFLNDSDKAQHTWKFQGDALESMPATDALMARVHSLRRDQERLDDLVARTKAATPEGKAARAAKEHVDEQLDHLGKTPVASLPDEVRQAIKAKHGEDYTYTRKQKRINPATKRKKTYEIQVGAKRLPAGMTLKQVMDDDGIVWYTAKGDNGPLPGAPEPMLYEPGPLDDPYDYTHHLPEMRRENAIPVMDPRVTAFYRGRAEGVLITYRARWETIDEMHGRDRTDPDLIANSDGSRFVDQKTGQEYERPIINNEIPPGVDDTRLWPTQVIANESWRLNDIDGVYRDLFYTGLEEGTRKVLSMLRYGATTPFPAYHVRNLISDTIKSLQADAGVMFHPIVNWKLTKAAFGKGHGDTIEIPGHGEWKMEDFLFMADTFGLRSGHHVAEVYRLLDGESTASYNAIQRILGKRYGVIGPTSAYGQMVTRFGFGREDVVRFMTFMQRMRVNGGDAGDASAYMIMHHFNYNDLTYTERRHIRNAFLFYTWYRNNIPLQLMELVRKPGFFSGMTSTYRDLERGETPLNQDFGEVFGIPMDLSEGVTPLMKSTIPEYRADKLMAPVVNWNGFAVSTGFGAPWADLSHLAFSEQGARDLVSMMNPLVQVAYELFSREDVLTGADFDVEGTSGMATLLNSLPGIGKLIGEDTRGKAMMPWWANVILSNIPVAGRGTGMFEGTGITRDQGRLQTWGKRTNWITGLNFMVAPKPKSERWYLGVKNRVVGRNIERSELLEDLPKYMPKERKKEITDKFDKETREWAKEQHIPFEALQSIEGSPFYITKEEREAGGDTGPKLGGGSSDGGLKLGGSSSGGISIGASSSSGSSSGNRQLASAKPKRPIFAHPDRPHAKAVVAALAPKPAPVQSGGGGTSSSSSSGGSSYAASPAQSTPAQPSSGRIVLAGLGRGQGGGGSMQQASASPARAMASASASVRGTANVKAPSLNASQRRVLGTILSVGAEMGANEDELLAATVTALTESNFSNPAGGDGTSRGWRQETASSYPNVNRNDVAAAARRFFSETRGHRNSYKGDAAGLSHAVQRSAYPNRPRERLGEARRILSKVEFDGSGATVQDTPDAQPTTRKYATGYQPGGTKVVVDEDAAIIDALIERREGESLADRVLANLSSGAYMKNVPQEGKLTYTTKKVPGTSAATAAARTTGQVQGGGGWGGSKGIAYGATEGMPRGSQKRTTQNTASGGVSDHWVGATTSYAIDVPATGATGTRFAHQMAKRLGIKGYSTGNFTGYTVTGAGGRKYRVQILWNVADHYDHVHLGVKAL